MVVICTCRLIFFPWLASVKMSICLAIQILIRLLPAGASRYGTSAFPLNLGKYILTNYCGDIFAFMKPTIPHGCKQVLYNNAVNAGKQDEERNEASPGDIRGSLEQPLTTSSS